MTPEEVDVGLFKKRIDPFKLSIKKWENIVKLLKLGFYDKDDPKKYGDYGSDNCALCIWYGGWRNGGLTCSKCPIYHFYPKWLCRGTPFRKYVYAVNEEEKLVSAIEELEFLRGLEKKWRKVK